ncbi:hypothetical protein [Peribacillus acanthi]|uniref:hypothetical protein n=1 Tax=Peribacillus acanthi TaxID=2171554 RepID=UPI000D3E2B4A|nr:hypothetical protein [Peribacillus acanthi]
MDYNQIIKREEEFRNEHISANNFLILKGNLPVMVSAPHAVKQIRNGRVKQSESYTGVIAELLHENGSIHSIIKTRNNNDDANYDKNCLYKLELIKYIKNQNIKFLLDLHIMNESYKNSIEIATGYGENIQKNYSVVDTIIKVAKSLGFNDFANDYHFKADNPNCVAAFVSKHCKIPAIQMEINWREINAEKNRKGFYQIYLFLLNTLEEMSKQNCK